MASIADILRTIQGLIVSGINSPTTGLGNVQTPGQVIVGWPTGSEAAKIWGQNNWLVSIYALKTEPITRYRPTPYIITLPTAPTLTATITQQAGFNVIALSGQNQAGLNINTTYGPNPSPSTALYQTNGTETLAQLASFIAAGITGSFVSATATGANVHVTGGYPLWCNIGQAAMMVQEVARYRRNIQVTIWAPYPDNFSQPNDATRENLEASVIDSLGGTDSPWIVAPDGSTFQALWRSTGDWSDKAESSYTVFRSDNYLEIEYPQLKTLTGNQIGVVDLSVATENAPGFTSTKTYPIGGP